jgi:hypothetical protein
MLVSEIHDFIIFTPTKTGTFSWEAAMRKYPAEVQWVKPRHKLTPPVWMSAPETRYMLVRNPYSRLVSVWWYLGYIGNSKSQWGHRYVMHQNFSQFLPWFEAQRELVEHRLWIQGRAPHMWTKSLTQCAEIAKPDRTLMMEHMWDNWQNFGVLYGLYPTYDHHSNIGKHPTWASLYDQREVEIANRIWCEDDCRSFDYDLIDPSTWRPLDVAST